VTTDTDKQDDKTDSQNILIMRKTEQLSYYAEIWKL